MRKNHQEGPLRSLRGSTLGPLVLGHCGAFLPFWGAALTASNPVQKELRATTPLGKILGRKNSQKYPHNWQKMA